MSLNGNLNEYSTALVKMACDDQNSIIDLWVSLF